MEECLCLAADNNWEAVEDILTSLHAKATATDATKSSLNPSNVHTATPDKVHTNTPDEKLDSRGRTLAHLAAMCDKPHILRMLRDMNYNLRQRSFNNRTPLDECIYNNQIGGECYNVILEHCYSAFEQLDRNGDYSLSAIKRFLPGQKDYKYSEHKSSKVHLDLNDELASRNHMTVLEVCIELGEQSAVEYILDTQMPDILHRDNLNNTMLHHVELQTSGEDNKISACSFESFESEDGDSTSSDGGTQNNAGDTYSNNQRKEYSEKEMQHRFLVDMDSRIPDYPLKPDSSVYTTNMNLKLTDDPVYRSIPSLRLLEYIVSQVDCTDLVNEANDDGDTPILMYCATCEDPAICIWACRLLIDKGANINSKNVYSGMNCPMMLSERFGGGPWVDWWLKIPGFPSDSVDIDGKSLAEYIAIHKEKRDNLISERQEFFEQSKAG